MSWVDDNLHDHNQHAPTIGLLLCAGRNDNVVRYSLAETTAPSAVADYTYDTLPAPVRELVPTDDELASAVGETLTDLKESRSSRADVDATQPTAQTALVAPPDVFIQHAVGQIQYGTAGAWFRSESSGDGDAPLRDVPNRENVENRRSMRRLDSTSPLCTRSESVAIAATSAAGSPTSRASSCAQT